MRKTVHTKTITLFLFLSVVTVFLFLSGCTQQPTNNSGTHTVTIVNYAYNPSTLTVSNGTTVTWINNDNDEHTVTADDGLFDSGLLTRGQQFTYTFITPGTYTYFCIPHPYMTGTIIVQ